MTPIPRTVATFWSVTTIVGMLAVPPAEGARAGRGALSASAACTAFGTPGDDVITGTSGDDVICGLEGNDRIDAGAGNDVLEGGPGDDHLTGGEGEDRASYEAALEGVAADLGLGVASGEGSDVLEGVEGVTGSPSDDILTGSTGPDTLSGLGGTDLLFGQEGGDTLLGGEGDDYLTGSAGSLLDGGEGTDTCRLGPGPVAVVSCLNPSPQDQDDTHGFLDVKQVASFLETDVPAWRIVTISRWSVFRMWDRGFVVVYLDTFGGALPDYYALIRSVGARLRAKLYRNGHRLASLPVWRRNSRSVSIRVPLDKLLIGAERFFYRWRVVTLTDRCRRTCFDHIPDEGAMVEPLLALPD